MINKNKSKEIRKVQRPVQNQRRPQARDQTFNLQPQADRHSDCPYCHQEIISRLMDSHLKICSLSPENTSIPKQRRIFQNQNQQRQPPSSGHKQQQRQQQQEPPPRQRQSVFRTPSRSHNQEEVFMDEEFNQDRFDQPRFRQQQNIYQFRNNPLGFDFDGIFGPNGVFTQSMNQMMSTMNQAFGNVSQNFQQMNGFQQQYNNNVFRINDFPSGQTYIFTSSNDPHVDFQTNFHQYRNQDHFQHQQQSPQQGMNRTNINQMPTFKYKEEQKREGSSNSNCVICMTDFKRGEKLRTLPCTHLFHVECVDNWLQIKGECPICRFSMR